jgi:acyl transferase domain-containing protein
MVQKNLDEYDRKIKQLESEVARLKHKHQEPIAIIGLGCRFPGGSNNPNSFWENLEHGRSAVTEVPSDRWDVNEYYSDDVDLPGKMYTKHGAFIDDADKFEPEFFNLTPREAERMDPQQRLFLEVAWEAFESAGVRMEDLFETKTGVYLGVSSHDFVTQYLSKGMNGIDGYYGTGTQFSLAVGRLSYWLGLQGPSMVIDTACSSSLVALHEACQSLRNSETDMAIAGGVHLMLTPELTIYCSKANMISRDGKCKTFDESADGYGRGEGCGAVILKRLSDAESANDNILAVVRGSLINQDGKSAGITAPNRLSQEKLIKETLSRYSIQPEQVKYMECHGTGTILGDPIELTAIQNVFEEFHNADNPLYLGSVKANISHLEAAAGIAGVIKVILALQKKKIPPHINFNQLNSHVGFCQDSFRINKTSMDWVAQTDSRIAGVSSFGFSGTNAFALLEEAPERKPMATEAAPFSSENILCITAKNADALNSYIENYINYLENTEDSFADICFSANTCRSTFPHRIALVAKNKDDCRKKLTSYLGGKSQTDVAHGTVKRSNPYKLAFYLPAQLNHPGKVMQQFLDDLCKEDYILKEEIVQLDVLLQKKFNSTLKDILNEYNHEQNNSNNSHLPTFLIEYIVALQWIRYGATPDIFIVDGIGEYVAACLTGLWSLEDGLEIVAKLNSSYPSDSLKNALKKIHCSPIKDQVIKNLSTITLREQDFCEEKEWWKEAILAESGTDLMSLIDKKSKYTFVGFGDKLNFDPTFYERVNWIDSMNLEEHPWNCFRRSLLTAFVAGKKISWENLYAGLNLRKRSLPTYPFQRRKIHADFE